MNCALFGTGGLFSTVIFVAAISERSCVTSAIKLS
jgi:hypothetical protein